MDTKNVIAAISLSAAVIILYSLFFAPAVVDQKVISNEKKHITETLVTHKDSSLTKIVIKEDIIKP